MNKRERSQRSLERKIKRDKPQTLDMIKTFSRFRFGTKKLFAKRAELWRNNKVISVSCSFRRGFRMWFKYRTANTHNPIQNQHNRIFQNMKIQKRSQICHGSHCGSPDEPALFQLLFVSVPNIF